LKREGKAAKDKPAKKTKSAAAPKPTKAAAAAAAAASKTVDEAGDEDEETANDAAIAAKLAATRESSRNRDATGAKGRKKAALAAFREVSYCYVVSSALSSWSDQCNMVKWENRRERQCWIKRTRTIVTLISVTTTTMNLMKNMTMAI
jgi:hypothetical protein